MTYRQEIALSASPPEGGRCMFGPTLDCMRIQRSSTSTTASVTSSLAETTAGCFTPNHKYSAADRPMAHLPRESRRFSHAANTSLTRWQCVMSRKCHLDNDAFGPRQVGTNRQPVYCHQSIGTESWISATNCFRFAEHILHIHDDVKRWSPDRVNDSVSPTMFLSKMPPGFL
jgi:hypothetical protein